MYLFEKVIIGMIASLLLVLIVVVVYSVGDRVGVAEFSGRGTVVDRNHRASHTTMLLAGKILVPQYHPEKWEICIKKNDSGDIGCTEVSQEIYKTIQNGTPVDIVYFKGNWSGDLYITTTKFL